MKTGCRCIARRIIVTSVQVLPANYWLCECIRHGFADNMFSYGLCQPRCPSPEHICRLCSHFLCTTSAQADHSSAAHGKAYIPEALLL